MTMFILRIFVMGLVALVRGANGDLTIVLQQTPGGHLLHIPALIYPRLNQCPTGSDDGGCQPYDAKEIADQLNLAGNLVPSQKPTWLSYLGQQFGGVLLDGRQLHLDGAATGYLQYAPGRKHHPGDRFGALPLSAEEREDFSWVPAMADIWPQAQRINPRFVDEPSSKNVAGIIELSGIAGTVKTYKLADTDACTLYDKRPEIYSIDFRTTRQMPDEARPRQALADVVVIEVPIAGDMATISLAPLQDAPLRALSPITLRPDTTTGMADVLIGDLVPVVGAAGCQYVPNPHHFDLYYEISEARGKGGEGRAQPYPGVRKELATRINPDPKDAPIVDVVTKRVQLGVYNRPVCTLLLFEKSNP